MFDKDRVSRRTLLQTTGGSLLAFGASGLSAPGTDLTTTDADGSCVTLSGTSFATAHVSGVGALLAGQGYSNTNARVRMQETAEDLGLPSDQQGHGLVDAAAAMGLYSRDN